MHVHFGRLSIMMSTWFTGFIVNKIEQRGVLYHLLVNINVVVVAKVKLYNTEIVDSYKTSQNQNSIFM